MQRGPKANNQQKSGKDFLCKEDPKQTINKNQIKTLCKEDPKQTINKTRIG